MSDLSAEPSQELIPTRDSLLGRLKDWEDEASWKDFFETYWRLIYLAAIRSGLTEVEAQDVVQETVIEVCRRMPRFQYRPKLGSFKSWLLRLTYWRITDQFRRRQRKKTEIPLDIESIDENLESELPVASPEIESLWDDAWQGNLMAAAVQRVKSRIKARHFQIFDLCVVQEWPVGKVAKTLKITRGQVYLVKHRVSAEIKRETRQLEGQPLPVNEDEA